MAKAGDDDWIVDINVMLGCLKNNDVKACSISRVSDKIPEAKKEAYSPRVVSVGPFHRKTRSDLQLMEETKWRYMRALLRRARGGRDKVENCSRAIRGIDSVIRASYGDNIELKPPELARIMVLDGCFFLELLFRLYDNVNGASPLTSDEIDLILENTNDKILHVLTDLTLLENQIPFVVLTILGRELSKGVTDYEFPCPEKLAKSLFEYGDPMNGVYHFLHLMYLSSDDPFGKNQTSKLKAAKELKRCTRKLRAVGITIKTPQSNASTDNKTGVVASALREFVDRFDFKIDFDKRKRELIIPLLHIKGGTEVKWRNLIAWEQSGLIGIGYKFTSYAYFFKGLICSVHDIELLKAEKIIVVDDKKISDQKLLTMFQNVTTGAEEMDGRYSKLCEDLNTVPTGNRVKECRRMWWHNWRRFRAWLRYMFKVWIRIFLKEYIPDPWKFIALVVAAVLLALTIVQTYYAVGGQ